jgi:3-deoxy-D-manno-octulosonic-acid transferase
VIWIHAVSVGETRAAEPLIRALQREHPDGQILLTHMTPTGSRTAETLFGQSVLRCFLPYDYPPAVARFLDHFKPQVGVLMETEIWPNLIHACRSRGVPLYLVNARLSSRSLARYRRVSWLIGDSLRELAVIGAQTRDDGERFAALGAEYVVTGNVKFDIDPPPLQIAQGAAWRARYGSRPIVLAASTRDGEETMLLDAWEELDMPSALLVLVPRHPHRFEEVAALLSRRRLRYQRRSEDSAPAPDTQIMLGDSMGEMFAYYASCDVAFVGGSLLPYGGQNLIEGCAAGKPVVFGPHMYNFSEAAELAVSEGAAIRVADPHDLARVLRVLLPDRTMSERMGAAALAFSRAHRGATERTLDLIRF